jgi:hypothetical protein
MPLIVLGSFGDRKDTVQLPNGSHEVSPEYRGMEIPYLGETTASNGLGLTAGFMPDVKRPWAAYPDAQTRWRPTLKTDFLSFYGICHSEAPYWMAAYAFTEIHSPEDREAVLLAGSDHALRIWVNDRCVLTYGGQGTPRGGQRPSRPDQNRAEFMLKKGWNRLLVKAVQRGETRIFLRLTDKAGNPMDDLRFRVPTAG